MDIQEAIKILNQKHHGFNFPTKWRWVQYRDVDSILGVTLTKNQESEYAGDNDSVEGIWYSDFDAIAIAEKYSRDEKES